MTLFFLFSVCLVSCMPGGTPGPGGKAQRKKMLNLDGGTNGWDAYSLTGPATGSQLSGQGQYPPSPFRLADTIINFGSVNANFYVMRVPSDNLDFLLPLAKAYEPYLTAWMGAWAQTGQTGMAIDVSTGNATHRSAFSIENPSIHVSVPLVIFYDDASEVRATNLTKFIQSLATVRCTAL
jgi:hypothetical protein